MSLCRRLRLVLILSLAAVPIASSTAQAQAADELSVPGITIIPGELWSTSSTSTTTTLVTGLGIFSIQLATGDRRQLRAYLTNNAVAIQYDLHLGAGDLATDLAQIFDVDDEHLDQFAQRLFEHRRELSPLVVPGAVDDESTDQFASLVASLLIGLS